MEVAVWDTYVARAGNKTMHFDILVPKDVIDTETILRYGRDYLSAKSYETGTLTTSECRLCHIAVAPGPLAFSIRKKGYHIIEIENCD
ncbi:DUF2024 family protein [Flagellimonas sp. DF-77]|uniref:DUF2024 family protein n=1 Tax=Flagellimonas algarum TaxID=3230298 RepID=UPI003396030D